MVGSRQPGSAPRTLESNGPIPMAARWCRQGRGPKVSAPLLLKHGPSTHSDGIQPSLSDPRLFLEGLFLAEHNILDPTCEYTGTEAP